MAEARNNVVLEKSLDFALRIVRLPLSQRGKARVCPVKRAVDLRNEYRKAWRAAVGAENRETFASEFGVARRRAMETEYWLLVLHHGEILNEQEYNSIEADRLELVKIISSIHSSSRGSN